MALGDTFPPAPVIGQPAGGMGGLGGFIGNPRVKNVLQALGHSLLTSNGDAPLSGFSTALNSISQQQRQREEEERQRQSWGQAFGQLGLSPELQQLAQTNPQAAQLVYEQQVAQQQRQREAAERQRAMEADLEYTKQLTGGFIDPNALPVGGSMGPIESAPLAPVSASGVDDWSMPPAELRGTPSTAAVVPVAGIIDPKTAKSTGAADPVATGAAAPTGNAERQALMRQRDFYVRAAAAARTPQQLGQAKLFIDNIDTKIKALEGDGGGYTTLTDPAQRRAYGIPDDDTRVYQVSKAGQLSAVGGSGQAATPGAEARQREDLARQYGIDPSSAEGQRFILTGTLPASDKGVTAGDRQAIREADDAVMSGENASSLLDRALELSKTAYDGFGASTRAAAAAQLGVQAGKDTIELNNIVTEQALGQMKSIFGGNPTEGERAILLEIQGSSNQPQDVRENILRRAKQAIERRVAYNRDRAAELRGGTYYQPRNQPESDAATPADQTQPSDGWSDVGGVKVRKKR